MSLAINARGKQRQPGDRSIPRKKSERIYEFEGEDREVSLTQGEQQRLIQELRQEKAEQRKQHLEELYQTPDNQHDHNSRTTV